MWMTLSKLSQWNSCWSCTHKTTFLHLVFSENIPRMLVMKSDLRLHFLQWKAQTQFCMLNAKLNYFPRKTFIIKYSTLISRFYGKRCCFPSSKIRNYLRDQNISSCFKFCLILTFGISVRNVSSKFHITLNISFCSFPSGLLIIICVICAHTFWFDLFNYSQFWNSAMIMLIWT